MQISTSSTSAIRRLRHTAARRLRFKSTKTEPDSQPSASTASASAGAGAAAHPQKSILARTLARLRQKHPHIEPASLVASFLILHELTAVLPLFGVFSGLQYFHAGDAVLEQLKDCTRETAFEKWISEAEDKAGRMVKKGYFASGALDGNISDQSNGSSGLGETGQLSGTLTNVAASYLLVKALFPARLATSFWLAPRCSNIFGRWAGPWTQRIAARWSKRSGQT